MNDRHGMGVLNEYGITRADRSAFGFENRVTIESTLSLKCSHRSVDLEVCMRHSILYLDNGLSFALSRGDGLLFSACELHSKKCRNRHDPYADPSAVASLHN